MGQAAWNWVHVVAVCVTIRVRYNEGVHRTIVRGKRSLAFDGAIEPIHPSGSYLYPRKKSTGRWKIKPSFRPLRLEAFLSALLPPRRPTAHSLGRRTFNVSSTRRRSKATILIFISVLPSKTPRVPIQTTIRRRTLHAALHALSRPPPRSFLPHGCLQVLFHHGYHRQRRLGASFPTPPSALPGAARW